MLIKLGSRQPAKKYFVTMFAISCILLGAFTLVVYQQSRLNEASNDWVVHSYEVLRNARNALIHMYDGDIAERNYVETRTAGYLEAYNISIQKAEEDTKKLAGLVADNPSQQAPVASLRYDVEQFKKISAGEIASFQKHENAAGPPAFTSRARNKLISDMRNEIREFGQTESDLLNTRVAKAKAQRQNYTMTLFIGATLDLGAFILANLLIFSLIAKNERAEEKLRKSELLFTTILNGINDGIYDYDVVKGTISYSDSYPVIWGYSGEELGKRNDDFDAFIHPEDLASAKETMRQYMAKETPTYCNIFRVRHKDGSWRWVMSRGVGIWDDKGQIRRLIGTHTDITAQKQREEELNYFIRENERQKQELEEAKERAETASQAKSDFLATMSHEIRTPLNVVVGLARLLMDKVQTAQKREMAETLYANADILSKLVNDLLDLTRIESSQIELESRPFTLESIFKALRAMFDNQVAAKGLSLSMVDKSNDETLIGDPVRLQQILINLISNALKFTARGGITVTAESTPHSGDKTNLVLTVADTGIGISPDKLATIFEKFVQADQTISRRFGGSGLGLAISKSLAEVMGGDISVASKQGEGSVFTVRLVLEIGKRQTAVLSPIKPQTVAAPALRGTVLVVEDYAPNVMVATMMLENLGYSVEVASSGTEAIRKIENQKAPFVAILMDVQMQDMDGFEATRRIRTLEKERGLNHFIIGVTAHALAGDRDRCIDAGMNDYMSKPVHPDLLAQKLGALAQAA